jgi:Archaeal/vacuolar-type H+-ATPase subunit A
MTLYFTLKGEFFDSVYLQQNAFDPIDGATSRERQLNCFGIMENIINTRVTFKNKDEARSVFSTTSLPFHRVQCLSMGK